MTKRLSGARSRLPKVKNVEAKREHSSLWRGEVSKVVIHRLRLTDAIT